ncbi:uncharacterized protein BXZ73DRAFT_42613 [Epithele typhae]|uniref:uncharacterized protein n=1 Tax=Epithele typhae TaxID=378194 RepID=UPI002008DC60|nr:uncharacterized protein BXZ73DRAFT_42613 [Epithele typhae]KAH9940357.1 hypothetical protein BXZ73DRAFT_42613 [Epithele typhae]
MDTSPPTSIPRLRLPCHTLQYQNQALTPIASQSTQNNDFLRAEDDNEDAGSTSRIGAASIPDKSSPKNTMSSIPSADNPTARLRALLARVPNSPVNGAPFMSTSRHMSFHSTSDIESDFEPPPSTTTSSNVRESLKELFSHTLREAGNTARKTSRPRRNSIDGSEVESNTPKFEERVRHKASRQVLSDEEADKSSESLRSAASTFDTLQQRPNRSTSALPSLSDDEMVINMSMSSQNSPIHRTAKPPTHPPKHDGSHRHSWASPGGEPASPSCHVS